VTQPWNLYKSISSERDTEKVKIIRAQINSILYHCAEATRIVGILLQPYMPGKAAEMLDMLGVDESKRTFTDARLGADFTYGTARASPGKGAEGALFPPLAVED
jgi:methionyl-tRNA synthetase